MNYDGFELEEGVLPDAECRILAASLVPAKARRGRAGVRHLMSHPQISALACEERLLRIARRWVGPGAAPYRATLFEKCGDRNWLVAWHQDTALPLTGRFTSPEWGPWSSKDGILYAHAPAWALSRVVALRVHLDPSGSTNGPLKVVPGSHLGILSQDEVLRWAKEGPVATCLVGRGGVLAMRPLLLHSSSKAEGLEPRRVLHLEYASALDLAPGVTLALA